MILKILTTLIMLGLGVTAFWSDALGDISLIRLGCYFSFLLLSSGLLGAQSATSSKP